MSQGTRFTGDYNIAAINPAASNVIVTAHTLTDRGNLNIIGNVSEVTSDNIAITDNVVTLNAGETGAGVTGITAGIAVDRGTLSSTELRWNEAVPQWELSNDGVTYLGIATLSALGSVFSVVQDPEPQLGGNLDVQNKTIFSSNTAYVTFGLNGSEIGQSVGGIAIENTIVAPEFKADHNVIYTQEPAGGGSGVYVTNAVVQAEELITKSKAIIYSLIF